MVFLFISVVIKLKQCNLYKTFYVDQTSLELSYQFGLGFPRDLLIGNEELWSTYYYLNIVSFNVMYSLLFQLARIYNFKFSTASIQSGPKYLI